MLAKLKKPAVCILLLAPFFGESLSGATPPLDLILPWNLALMVGLYGCGALICREVVLRYKLGLVGLILLGAAYGVWEEGLVDRYWYDPAFWDDQNIGAYSVVGQTNLLLALLLTVFHSAVSICCSVLVVERIFPKRQTQPWVGRRGMIAAVIVFAVAVPVICGEFYWPSAPNLFAAALVMAALVGLAFWQRRFGFRSRGQSPGSARSRKAITWIAFTATLLFWFVVNGLPESGIAWPVGLLVAALPVAVAIWLISRRATGDRFGTDALRVITGILAFFALLDILIAPLARPDMLLSALAVIFLLRWLWRQEPSSAS
jgi:hypothetical protein